MTAEARLGRSAAHPLLVLGDDTTTDHISPAGQIQARSEAGRWLVANGEDPNDLNVYASRRGNWEVMLRGLYANRAARYELAAEIPPGSAVHVPTGEILPLWRVAERYRSEGQPVVVVAGERYGTGSSRDWAAKGLGLLGVRAVLAPSFERIHRSAPGRRRAAVGRPREVLTGKQGARRARRSLARGQVPSGRRSGEGRAKRQAWETG